MTEEKKNNRKEQKEQIVQKEPKAHKAQKEQKVEAIRKPFEDTLKIPETLPILVLRDIVVFPYMIVPLYAGRVKSKRGVDKALNSDRMILLLTQKDTNVEDPSGDDLYPFGTVAMIIRMLKLPDGRMRVLVQGISRVKVTSFKDDGRIIEAKINPSKIKTRNI